MKKLLISSLVIGGLAGSTLVYGQFNSVSAEETEDQSPFWNRDNHSDMMRSHMSSQNRRRTENSERSDSRAFEERNESYELDEEEFIESMEERHNQMWNFREENLSETERDQLEESESFFGNMRNHMRGFDNESLDFMFEWMEEMHGTFNSRRGMMNWNQDDADYEQPGNRNNREFMNRFNFFNSN
ncbi:hypothetical protein [Alkalibacterium indicireducens]|uniref:Uncharacterized protein n=1 Tax=Alkalibacterium indicireducens TaxID=398758 RepID=A0ABP3KZ99_9LACT